MTPILAHFLLGTVPARSGTGSAPTPVQLSVWGTAEGRGAGVSSGASSDCDFISQCSVFKGSE